MSETGFIKRADQENFLEDQFPTSTHGWNNVSCKLSEVKESEPFFTSNAEVISFEPSTTTIKYEMGTGVDISCLNPAEMDKYLVLEDFPFSDELSCFKHDPVISTAETAEDEKLHDDQSLLMVDHVSDPCHNYISDCGLTERAPHNEFRYLLENLRSDVYKENFELGGDLLWHINGQDTSNLEKESPKQERLVGLSSLVEIDNKCQDLMKLPIRNTDCDLQNLTKLPIRNTDCNLQDSTELPIGNTDCDLKDLTKPPSENTDSALVSSKKNIGSSEVACGELTQKRKRKPTKRYIEETSEAECYPYTKGIGYAVHQNKILHQLRDHNVLCHYRRGRPKKNLSHILAEAPLTTRQQPRPWTSSESENEDFEPSSSPTEQDGSKSLARRKHHRLWTLAEVMKLVEGVSKCGVGHWTKIKRQLFASSGYRTSVDLKDKWRNLLRASGAYVPGLKKEVGSKRKAQSGMVPQSVLRRVRDLAIIHPYPRGRSSRDSPRLPLSWNSP